MNEKPIVIKFGGEIVEDKNLLDNLAFSVKYLLSKNEKVILVHGGGPLASKLSQQLNIQPIKVGGRRVTCEKTLEVMKMTLSGVVSSNVLAVLKKYQINSTSVSGISIINAVQRPPKAVSGSDGEIINFGFVGDVKNVETSTIDILLNNNIVPVISPLSANNEGVILNINADTIAVEISKAISAKKIFLITQVGAVFKDLNNPQSRIPHLTVTQAKEKISKKIIQGGMIPKLEEGFKLLDGDLESFHIVGISQKDTLINELQSPGLTGTYISKN